jgi:hypothetical protein
MSHCIRMRNLVERAGQVLGELDDIMASHREAGMGN